MMAPVAAADARAASMVVDRLAGPVTNGVRLDQLREGRAEETLFLVPGLAGDPDELTGLVMALVGSQRVYAVSPLPEDADQMPVDSMQRMAQLMVAAIRRVQPAGPYHLGGYSFGGLLALELAQQLRAAGEEVSSLFLIEAVYDERYWPRGIWLRALVRRTRRQMARIVRLRPGVAIAEFRLCGDRLIKRLIRRTASAGPDPLRVGAADAATTRGRALSAMGTYQPRFYNGTITLIACSVDRHFGCDTVQLWQGYAENIEIQRIDGDHLTVMHDAESAAAVASVIDHRLGLRRPDWPGLRPMPGFARPMILTTMRWFASARLAHALIEAGFTVSACRPRRHALNHVSGLSAAARFDRVRRQYSVVKAIRRLKPDIILPDDERALALLRALYERAKSTDPQIAALIAHSLSDVGAWPSITSRTALANVAKALEVTAPPTEVVLGADGLQEWRETVPFVFKTDGSWGGRGVAIVRDRAAVDAAWRAISNPPGLARALKRMFFDLEAGPFGAWLRRDRPVVNAQRLVDGRDAIVTVACFKGRVLSLVCLEVVRAAQPKGPATVVRIIDHPPMASAARRLVERFGLTGFCGFDFILDGDGEYHLLELNSRVTPTCHLLVEGEHTRRRIVALFPAELVRNSGAEPLPGVLDRPARAPELARYLETVAARGDGLVARLICGLTRRMGGSRC